LRPFDLAEGVRAYYRLDSAGHGKRRAGDKSPGHRLFPDTISALLPEARIVHVIRRCRHYAEVGFERLVTAPEGELRRLADVLELPFHPAMLRSHERARVRLGEVTTWLRPNGFVLITTEERLHNHRLTRTPPDPTRIGRLAPGDERG
jgi:hypothetical protein